MCGNNNNNNNNENTETIIASYWSEQPTNLSVFRSQINYPSARRAVVRHTAGDITGRERCKEAPVCKEPPTHKRKDCPTRANAGGDSSLEVGGEPEGYSNIIYQRSGNIISPVESPGGER